MADARIEQPDRPIIIIINLAAYGRGDPDSLIAATLEHCRFPRLVAMMDEEIPVVYKDQ